jgi:hypothetical protein
MQHWKLTLKERMRQQLQEEQQQEEQQPSLQADALLSKALDFLCRHRAREAEVRAAAAVARGSWIVVL